MRNKIHLTIISLFALVLAACNAQEVGSTPTVEPTQTAFILIVTTTPSFTPFPSQTSLPTLTPTAWQTLPPPTASILDRCLLRTDWPVYEVKSGDTLSNLAVRTNTTVTTLQLANCIVNKNVIRLGQELYVPQLPSDDEPIVEDLILDFNINVSEASAGDTVTFVWEAETGTVIEIRHITGNNLVIGSKLAATGSLSYTLPSDLGDLTQLEFVINGIKVGDNGDILATPYSAFLDIVADEPKVTEEPEVTDEPEVTEEPESTEAVGN